MVKRNFWIDAKHRNQTPAQRDSWITGTVTEQVDDGMLAVALDGTPEDWPDVVAPADPGVFALGASVRLLRDSTGRVIQVAAPNELPEESAGFGVGAGGVMIVENEEIARDLADAVANTTIELGEAVDRIEAAEGTVAEATAGIEAAREAADNALAGVDAMKDDVQTALTGGVAIDRLYATEAGFDNAVIGTLVAQNTFVENLATQQFWTRFATVTEDAVIGGDLIVDGTVDVSKLRVTGALWTELLNVAGDATIGGELLADTITGKKLVGGSVVGATVRTAESGVRMSLSTVAGDSSRPGIWLYDSNTYRWTTQIDSAGIPAMFFYDASQNLLFKLSEAGAYWKDSSGARRTEIQPDSLRLFNDTPIHFYGVSEAARYGVIQRRNDTEGTGLQLFGGSTSSGYWSALSLLSASDGTKWQAQGIRSRTTTQSANLFIGSTGNLATSTSVKASKFDVQDQAPNWGLLDVPYRSWIDRQAMVDTVLGRAPLPEHRIIGAVAEEMQVKAPELCTFDAITGELNGIAYDRGFLALIPLMRVLLNRIEALEGGPITQWSDSPVYDDTAMLDEIAAYGAFPEESPSPAEPPEETI